MKQMIKNWKEIESLEDFITYSKEQKKILIKKPVSGLAESINEEITTGEINANSYYEIDLENITTEVKGTIRKLKKGDIIKLTSSQFEEFDTGGEIIGIVIGVDYDTKRQVLEIYVQNFYTYDMSVPIQGSVNLQLYDDDDFNWESSDMGFLSEGTKLYRHKVELSQSSDFPSNPIDIYFLSTKNSNYTFDEFVELIRRNNPKEDMINVFAGGAGLNTFADTIDSLAYSSTNNQITVNIIHREISGTSINETIINRTFQYVFANGSYCREL